MTGAVPQWVHFARKEPQTAAIGSRRIEIGAPDALAGEVLLTVAEDGVPLGYVLPTDPPSYRALGATGSARVDTMEDLIGLLAPATAAPRGSSV
ncbi:hypothetical protein NB037_17015 [Rathayibacter sp. ZW T2_19]|uniref:Uncharacterized protein n=1 Tax=Rathayibacter rubneri TaxID=2950106 RepID=A0A9X2DZJ5_9MICO|nr:hypothetical protein [Rathayibacter rubneri]MCM6764117.1 hypothetical protein [Rathayibacter rubneri]